MTVRTLIMGAAGRDFHNFNVFFRDNPDYEVVAFTAAQIPGIDDKTYPPVLAGPRYPRGIPIHPEARLSGLIRENDIQRVVFAYSDVSHETVMHKASQALAAGADFWLLGPEATQLVPRCKVISVCAVRTGCGKSQTSRKLARLLRERGIRTVAVRHAMPYGRLERQVAQRFATLQDLSDQECTIEEMEEYEPYIHLGIPVYAGVDYGVILKQAESEAEVIIWDGGNNDLPFYRSDLEIVVADPHRPGHELRYHPGEANFRRADVVVVNKIDSADPAHVTAVLDNLNAVNPGARVIRAESELNVEQAEKIRGKRVLVVEDGPTLTHGGMRYGAGTLAAKRHGAAELLDPRPWAQGSLRATFETYPDIGPLLPAMGYGKAQIHDLEQTIQAAPCDLVVIGTPVDLNRVLRIDKPTVRVTYELRETGDLTLETVLDDFLKTHGLSS